MSEKDCKDCIYMKRLEDKVLVNKESINSIAKDIKGSVKTNTDDIKEVTRLVNKLITNQAADSRDQSNLYDLVSDMSKKIDKYTGSVEKEITMMKGEIAKHDKLLALNDKDTNANKSAIESINDLKMKGMLKILTMAFMIIGFLSTFTYVMINLLMNGGT